MKQMSLGQARQIAGTLSFPSKMPGTSYALPASKCLLGAKLAKIEGTVCHGCYALTGLYNMGNVRKAMNRRLAGLSDPRWSAAMIVLLRQKHATPTFRIDLGIRAVRKKAQRWRLNVSGWHRWHDSGDLQGAWHLAKICEVAAATPKIRHWLATREAKMVKEYVDAGGIVPPNLVIRISATLIDRPAPSAWPLTSTVHDHLAPIGFVCRAPSQNHECKECRACWSPDVANISYRKH
jgi:hypothetical protein